MTQAHTLFLLSMGILKLNPFVEVIILLIVMVWFLFLLGMGIVTIQFIVVTHYQILFLLGV